MKSFRRFRSSLQRGCRTHLINKQPSGLVMLRRSYIERRVVLLGYLPYEDLIVASAEAKVGACSVIANVPASQVSLSWSLD
jgi:hypothetical protein